jgi:dienelactone hydrolase
MNNTKAGNDHKMSLKGAQQSTRRDFLKSASIMGCVSFVPESLKDLADMNTTGIERKYGPEKSLIGSYGHWANGLMEIPPQLSFRRNDWQDLNTWRSEAMKKTLELVSKPDITCKPEVSINRKYQYDGLDIEELSWQLPYGEITEAYLLKPAGMKGKMPAVLGLHDHAAKKYFGKRKITRTDDEIHPMMKDHQRDYYEGVAWANAIARRGYVVLVHDTFTFGSRRVMFKDMQEIPWGYCKTTGMSDDNPEDIENINAYNTWSGEHEHIMAKSLFCAGVTWPGVFLFEDQCALDILSDRDEVDPERLGCAGLSGGGLRTVYLGGLDHRIKCAVCVGFMSTWSDFLLNKSYTHTWMTYTPLLPKYLDFPEILGLRVPLATMTLSNNEDGLYTLSEMKRADNILAEVFAKAGVKDHYSGKFYPGDHKFDKEMQKDAFDWFDKWLQ